MKFILILYCSLFSTACAIGPLVIHETARTVGANNNEFIAGYGEAGYVIKWNHGLAENFDFGLHWESLSLGIRAKYALVNSRESGWSLAAALGTGFSIGGTHNYADLIGSYFAGNWEPYGVFRFVHVKNDPLEFKDQDTGNVSFTIGKSEYNYGQFIIGSRYWITQHWLFSIEAANLISTSSGFKSASKSFVGASFGYQFN